MTKKEAQSELKRAWLQFSYGYVEDALDTCRRARDMAPDHPLPPTLEASILIASGRPKQALPLLRQVMRRSPEATEARIRFAEACLFLGRTSQAERQLEELKALPLEEGEMEQVQALVELMESGLTFDVLTVEEG